jgi:hypothetical protein
MVLTTPPKEDKVDASSTEAPTAQALVARLGSKAPDDNLTNDDSDRMNFIAVESEVVCWMRIRLQRCCPDSGKKDCSIWYSGWPGFYSP